MHVTFISQYFSEQLSALKTQMVDLRMEGTRELPREVEMEKRMSREVGRGEQLQATVVRQTSYKHKAFERVSKLNALCYG